MPNPLGIPASWSWVNALGVLGFGIPLGVVAGMVAVQVRARRRPEPGMRAALWASRGLAANFVLCLALNLADSPLADGAFLRRDADDLDRRLRRDGSRRHPARPRRRGRPPAPARVHRGRRRGRHPARRSSRVFTLATSPRRLVGERARRRPRRRARRGAAARARARRVDRALYGHRDPSTAVRRLGEQLELADEPADALPGVADALRETLGASGVRIEPDPVVALAPARAGAELYEPGSSARSATAGCGSGG